jgi:hypothetical protein
MDITFFRTATHYQATLFHATFSAAALAAVSHAFDPISPSAFET